MPSVAEHLRNAREAQGLSVTEVADITKLKGDHVRALEEGNYDYFAAPVYIRGFVRTLCRLLKLDEQVVMQQLDIELSQTKNYNAPPSLTGQASGPLDKVLFMLSRVPWRIVLPVIAIGLVAAVTIWAIRHHAAKKNNDPLRDLGPGMYQAPHNNSGPTLPLPPAPKK